MPSTSIQLSWAVPVDILKLGAHLEAYTNLRPTLQILHLCKRSAKQKLPVDILDIVAALLIDEERERCLSEWSQPLKCWEERCCQADHFAGEIRAKIEADPDFEVMKPYMLRSWNIHDVEITGRSPKEAASLASKIQTERQKCRDIHHENVRSWHAKVNRLSAGPEGQRDDMSDVLSTVFGLEACCHHERLKVRRVNPWAGRQHSQSFLDGHASFINMCPTTTAYLRLPGLLENIQRTDETPIAARPPTNRDDQTAIGWSTRPDNAQKPSSRSLSRFTRAMKILKLLPVRRVVKEHHPKEEGYPNGDGNAYAELEVEAKEDAVEEDDEVRAPQQPALTMFVVDTYSSCETSPCRR
ncbi:unnamed protein product [Zymoseptoria tritici ST99CH_1A5]|uniref:Uncharacterized protein n=1 Tax=Zymoseptoria tritici ST99CH_1A5 TaxID=1276529 RepID=A0A1Y6LFA6_ZYMTR|nr:unnamed protein product [Zymoseptoria tritici ST99CH_1A5]